MCVSVFVHLNIVPWIKQSEGSAVDTGDKVGLQETKPILERSPNVKSLRRAPDSATQTTSLALPLSPICNI